MKIGQIDISEVKLDLHCRDEIPALLRGLQFIYTQRSIRTKVFKLLEELVPLEVDMNNGRTGMDLWSIFVLGTLRLVCNWDYDKLQEIADNHITLRQMLGIGVFDCDKRFPRQTLNDNIRWFTPEVLDKINQVVFEARNIVTGNPVSIHARCDSFVVETDVHFPTDINLLWDAIRKTLSFMKNLSELYGVEGWRQAKHLLRKLKKLYRKCQKERDKDKKSNACLNTTTIYLQEAADVLKRAQHTLDNLNDIEINRIATHEIQYFIEAGLKQIDQAFRRCVKDEAIPHSEKVFSLFEPHTEWISKGKAGVPQELGLRVCVVESSDGFILHYRVMENVTDDKVAVPIIKETKQRYEQLNSCSFDKGFHSPENQIDLRKVLDLVVLPKKGKLNSSEKVHENSSEFRRLRRKHSAVESGINGLEHDRLSRCCDSGIVGFKRYVALAVVARNIHLLGSKLRNRELEKIKRAA